MSDEATATSKRGSRKAAADKPAEKVEAKKRGRKDIKSAEEADDGGDSSPPKRGRGRPKGTSKRKSPVKPKAKPTGGRRGRPKKDKKESADEDNEENDGGDDEDD